MKVICETDYQDIYQIQSGVRLVINKFKVRRGTTIHWDSRGKKFKRYAKGCSPQLETCKEEFQMYCYKDEKLITCPPGTPLYCEQLIEKVDPQHWKYLIRSAGGEIDGNAEETIKTLKEIINLIERKNENDGSGTPDEMRLS